MTKPVRFTRFAKAIRMPLDLRAAESAAISALWLRRQITGPRFAPSAAEMIAQRTRKGWKTGSDYRLICPCQHHAAREASVWRRAGRVASRGVAVLMSIPLAMAAFDLPISAMSIKTVAIDSLRVSRASVAAPPRKLEQKQPEQPSALPIFTTDAVREQFLAPARAMSLDVFKEQYFRANVPYGAIIYREARKNNLPPELVAAMVHTESDFRPQLVSNKSAQGLMQIVPDTARTLGIANPFDPEQNIAAGTKYFRYLLNRFDDQRIALAAYNAGPTNVERFGGVPPFAETKAYIEKVNRRHNRYRQRVQNTYMATVRLTPGAH
jgi:soluble lytic murein transglycosylase-like protein